MELPEVGDVIQMIKTAVVPALGTTAVVFFVGNRLRKNVGFVTALAVLTGLIVGNYFRQTFEWLPGIEALPQALKRAAVELPAERYWWPWLVGASLAATALGRIAGGTLQLGVAGLAGWLLVASVSHHPIDWLFGTRFSTAMAGLFATVAFVNFLVLERLARTGPPALAPTVAGMLMFAASGLMFLANSARYSEFAVFLGASMLGLVPVAWWMKTPTPSAMPAVAIGLPALMLIAKQTTHSDVPLASFVLLAACPWVLLLVRRRVWLAAGLVLGIAGAAVGLAAYHSP